MFPRFELYLEWMPTCNFGFFHFTLPGQKLFTDPNSLPINGRTPFLPGFVGKRERVILSAAKDLFRGRESSQILRCAQNDNREVLVGVQG